MQMGKYILIEDFNKLTYTLTKNIVEKIAKEENITPENITSSVVISQKGKLVNLAPQQVKMIILSEESPEVYLLKPRPLLNALANTNIFKRLHVRIVVKVFGVVYVNNLLDLPEEKYTFNSYEDYLDFFTGKYKDKNVPKSQICTIHTNVKEAGIGCELILTDIVETTVGTDRVLENSDFTSLEKYRALSVAVQQKVDEVMCPLVINSKNVSVDLMCGTVDIQLDKHGILEHVRCTDKFSDEINKLINDLPVR